MKKILVFALCATQVFGLFSFKHSNSTTIPKGNGEITSNEPKKYGQWSGYVYEWADNGDTFTFFTSCGVSGTPKQTIKKNQLVSLKQNGTCYQHTLYYLVYNY